MSYKDIKDVLFNKNFWLGIVWFFIVWLGASWGTKFVGDNLTDEYMGMVVEIGIVLFVLGVISSFIINRYRKKFVLGFMTAFVVALFIMFSTIQQHF